MKIKLLCIVFLKIAAGDDSTHHTLKFPIACETALEEYSSLLEKAGCINTECEKKFNKVEKNYCGDMIYIHISQS